MGIAYVAAFNVLTWVLTAVKQPGWLIPAGLVMFGVGGGGDLRLPEWALFRSPFRQAYSRAAGQRHPPGVLHGPARGALAPSLGHRRGIGRVLHAALAGPADVVIHVLHVPAGRLPAFERRRGPPDQLARLLHRPLHAMGRVRLRPGHAHPPPSLPGDPHYRLRDLHEILKQDHSAYRQQVIETDGTFREPLGPADDPGRDDASRGRFPSRPGPRRCKLESADRGLIAAPGVPAPPGGGASPLAMGAATVSEQHPGTPQSHPLAGLDEWEDVPPGALSPSLARSRRSATTATTSGRPSASSTGSITATRRSTSSVPRSGSISPGPGARWASGRRWSSSTRWSTTATRTPT